jgi:hypothetical protein
MKIEIVKESETPDGEPAETPVETGAEGDVPDETPEESVSPGESRKKGVARFLARLKKACFLVVAVAVLVVAAPPAYRLYRKWAQSRSEQKAAAEDLYRRRVRAQRAFGCRRLKPVLFGPREWSRTFSGEEAKRWKRIAAAFECRRWAEAVPLILGETPPAPYPEKERAKRRHATSRPFPSADEIDKARNALAAELDKRGRTLSGIRSLVDGLNPSPSILVSDSASPFVSGAEVVGRGVAELRSDLEREDWLGLANRLLQTEHELYPSFDSIREPLRAALAKTEAFLVCRGTSTDADLRVLFLFGDEPESPRVVPLHDRLPDGSGWMIPWDMHVREAFILTPEMARRYTEKFGAMRNGEAKRLNELSVKYRLGSLSQEEYERERAKGGAVEETFLEWARSGKTEEDARKNTFESAETVFAPLGRPNRVYVNGALAGTSPKLVPIGTKGRDWKKMIELHGAKDWAGIVRMLGSADGDAPPSANAIREARGRFAAFRLNVRVETAQADGEDAPEVWVAELLPSDLGVYLKSRTGGKLDAESIPRSFVEEIVAAEEHPDGGYVVEFPVVRSELAVFLGDPDAFEEKLDEVNEKWEKGVAGIRRRIELTEIDDEEALQAAAKLANRIKRDFVAWLGEN